MLWPYGCFHKLDVLSWLVHSGQLSLGLVFGCFYTSGVRLNGV